MNTTLGRILRPTIGKLLLFMFRVRAHGKERVPSTGAILAGNHVSHMDPVLLWCASPRPVHFMAKQELWDSGFLAWLLPRVWAFPVNRAGADRNAIDSATRFAQGGDLVGVFPEGTRSDDASTLGEAHGGAAFIAMRADVPVVPVGFVGTDNVMPKGRKVPRLRRVTVVFGDPIHPREYTEGSRKDRVAAMTGAIMEGIGTQLEKARELH